METRSRSGTRRRGGSRASRLVASAGPPRYQQVADELTGRIAAGKYPVGANLPTELELCRQYRISRHTVREALRRLRDNGLISRRRRAGTEVVARTPPASYRQPTNSISDFLQYAEETEVTVLRTKRVTSDADLAELLDGRPGGTWIRIDSLRTFPADPRPICMTAAYVSADLPGIEEHLEHQSGPLLAVLERIYGLQIARIEQTIQAIRLGKRQAKLLRAEVGSPALRAVRRYYDSKGKLIEQSTAVHPADRFTYVTNLVRR
jgi:DNA-binding GntR family transcriptional regulator